MSEHEETIVADSAAMPLSPIDIPELNVPILFWVCPVCEHSAVEWHGKKASCCRCGQSNDDSVCQCGKPSAMKRNGEWVGCCNDCLPF